MAIRRGVPAPGKQPDAPPVPFYTIPHLKQRAFLTAYAQTGMLNKAAEMAGCDRTSHYDWKADPDYAAAFQRAKDMAADLHEDEATRRALGWEETHYAHDGTPYTIKKYSDTMLIVRLKALRPDDYLGVSRRDERTDVSELLKAVLLELVERRQGRDVTPEAEWAPLPPGERPPPGRVALPAPPDIEEG